MNINDQFRAALKTAVEAAQDFCADIERIVIRIALTVALLYGVWHFLRALAP
jgi:hypothetical protein